MLKRYPALLLKGSYHCVESVPALLTVVKTALALSLACLQSRCYLGCFLGRPLFLFMTTALSGKLSADSVFNS